MSFVTFGQRASPGPLLVRPSATGLRIPRGQAASSASRRRRRKVRAPVPWKRLLGSAIAYLRIFLCTARATFSHWLDLSLKAGLLPASPGWPRCVGVPSSCSGSAVVTDNLARRTRPDAARCWGRGGVCVGARCRRWSRASKRSSCALLLAAASVSRRYDQRGLCVCLDVGRATPCGHRVLTRGTFGGRSRRSFAALVDRLGSWTLPFTSWPGSARALSCGCGQPALSWSDGGGARMARGRTAPGV